MRFKVEDKSMHPTLQNGDYLVVNKFSRKFSAGDIVVFRKNGKFFVKRIKEIQNEKYFVDGDNTLYSKKFDISRKKIIGKVLFRISY